jgi:nicotinamidase/pyrazinamidase
VSGLGRALLLVDLQNDFLPGGALAVNAGHEVIPVANKLLMARASFFDVTVSTKDWHPKGHKSFASSHEGRQPGEKIIWSGLEQVLWPDHCVQGTFGAEFSADLLVPHIDKVFEKGADTDIDSYSGFFDNGRRNDTGLAGWLRNSNVTRLTIMGLATDYCVKWTVLDAIGAGFQVDVILDGCRAVELNAGDRDKALGEMRDAGARILGLDEFMSRMRRN